MVFTSLTFLYAFLPVTLVLYYILKNRHWRNMVLLVSSLIFYAWGEPHFIGTMLLVTAIAYVGGLLMARFDRHGAVKTTVFAVTVILIILNLIIFKYLGFLGSIVRISVPEIVLPIGVSFYTFQVLSYVIDLYRKKIGLQKDPLKLLMYVCLFPQLIAGPIVRYETVEYELTNRQEIWDDFVSGLRRFVIGAAKKVLIANQVSVVSSSIFAIEQAGTLAYWLAALAYTLQIYFDFSGYSDMAIGLGRMFGFHFLENFNYPYIACSITDFWHRWHISLSSWFRDYIYIPLGGNRRGTLRWIRNILAVWALTGLWHGASWNFVLWGLYYAVFLLLEKFLLHQVSEKLPRVINWLFTFIVVMVGWVIFELTDLSVLLHVLGQMFCYAPTKWLNLISQNSDILLAVLYVPVGMLLSFPVARKLFSSEDGPTIPVQNLICLVLFVLCIIYLISSVYNPFIYFRF